MALSVTSSNRLTLVLRGFIYLILLVFAFLFFSAFLKMRERDQREACVKRMHKVATGVLRYAEKHDDRFPPSATWADAVLPTVPHDMLEPDKCFQCAAGDRDARSHLGFNVRLSGLSRSNVSHDTVMLFEVDGGWNVAGNKESMLKEPRHAIFIVSLADGSTMMLNASRLKELRWEP